MKRIERIEHDGTEILEPAMGDKVNVDNAIVDRLFSLTDEQRRRVAGYVVTEYDTSDLVDAYSVTRNPHDGTYRIRLNWLTGDAEGLT